MTDVARALELEPLWPVTDMPEIRYGFAGDMLSNVLAKAPAGALLATIQTHLNVVAIAAHRNLAAIVFTGGRRPEDSVIARAREERIALFTTKADTFEVSGRLYQLGIRGGDA